MLTRSKNAQLTNRFISPGDFFVFYIQNVNKKNYLFEQKIPRTFADAHAMHTFQIICIVLLFIMCIFYVHFGAFSMVKLALKCTKSMVYSKIAHYHVTHAT